MKEIIGKKYQDYLDWKEREDERKWQSARVAEKKKKSKKK